MPLGQRIAQVLVTLIIWAVATRAWLAHGSPVDVHGVIAWNGGMDMTPRRLPTALAPRRPLRRPLGLLSPERNSRERNSLEHGLRPSHRHFTTGSNMLGGTATPRLRHVDRLPPLHVFGSQPPSAPNSGGDQGGEDYTSPDLQHWFQSEDFDAAIDGMFEELQGSATANAIKADSDNVLRLEDVRLNPLLVDEALMREEAMRLRVVNYMQAVYVARKRPMLVQAKDEVRGRLNDVAMHRMLRFVPSYAVAERFWSDALFWYWRYRGEGLNIPLMVIAGAALQVESSIAEIKLEKEQVVGKSYDLAVPPSSVEELRYVRTSLLISCAVS